MQRWRNGKIEWIKNMRDCSQNLAVRVFVNIVESPILSLLKNSCGVWFLCLSCKALNYFSSTIFFFCIAEISSSVTGGFWLKIIGGLLLPLWMFAMLNVFLLIYFVRSSLRRFSNFVFHSLPSIEPYTYIIAFLIFTMRCEEVLKLLLNYLASLSSSNSLQWFTY